MKRKLVSALVMASAYFFCILMALNNTFLVRSYNFTATLYSDEAKAQYAVVDGRLNGLIGASIFECTASRIGELFQDCPYIAFESVSREYPDRIVISATERAEVFAIGTEGGYRHYSKDGVLLTEKSENSNNVDGEANVLLEGLVLNGALSENGVFLRFYGAYVEIEEAYGNMRAEIKSVLFSEDGFVLTMRSGTKIIAEPTENADLLGVLPQYYALSESEKKTAIFYA